jgi:hypothetical protein
MTRAVAIERRAARQILPALCCGSQTTRALEAGLGEFRLTPLQTWRFGGVMGLL